MHGATPVIDRSIGSLSGSSQPLFAAARTQEVTERFVHNPSTTNTIAINLTGGAAALNAAGSITIAAGGFWAGSVSSAINVIGTAGQPVTAGER